MWVVAEAAGLEMFQFCEELQPSRRVRMVGMSGCFLLDVRGRQVGLPGVSPGCIA